MPEAVDAVDAGPGALVFEAAQLFHVAHVGRDEAAPAGQYFGFIQQLSLFGIADGDFPGAAALGPAVFQGQCVAPVGPFGLDLDGFFPPQAEDGLQPQRHGGVRVCDPGQVVAPQGLCLADLGHVLAVAYAVVAVVAGHHVLFANLLGPPAQLGHAVLQGAGGQALGLPARHQVLHVLGLQAVGVQVPKTAFLQLVGHEVEHAFAVALGGVAAVAVAAAHLLELVVQVFHGGWWLMSFGVGCGVWGVVCPCRGSVVGSRFAVAGVYGSGQCFCPFRTPWRCENCWGHGTPRPLFADACSCLGWPPRHAALASTGLAVARLAVDVGPVPGPGCTVCSADKRRPAAGRWASAEGRTALRGAPGDGRRARHLGPSLATALGAALNGWGGMSVVTTGWRRVVTTRSAGAVGAAVACGCWFAAGMPWVSPLGLRPSSGGGRPGPSVQGPGWGSGGSMVDRDRYLQALRLPGCRRSGRLGRPPKRAGRCGIGHQPG